MDNGQFPNLQFPLLDRYMGLRMEVDFAALRPGKTAVVESSRRLKKELSYGYVHALWWIWLADGRSAVSVPPGSADAVRDLVGDIESVDQLQDPGLPDRLKQPVDAALVEQGLDPTDRSIRGIGFACNGALLRRHFCGDCRQLYDGSIPAADGLSLPTHCFTDGIVYAVVADGVAASIAYPHRSHLMADRVADLGIETAPAYRERGYAKAVVSAAVHHITRVGGEALYGTSPDNAASVATARSVGFVPYTTRFILSSPSPEAEHQLSPQP